MLKGSEQHRINQLERAVEKWSESVASRLLRVLCPIYTESVHRPEPVGTGILIRVEELIFLVSAAHVIEDVGRGPRYFGAADQLLPLPAFNVKTPVPEGGSRDDDPLDIGYWILDPATARKLSSVDTLRLSDLDYREPAIVARDARYFLNGYPASRQPRKVRDGAIEARTLAFLTEELNDGEYVAAGRKRREHLLVTFAKDNFFLGGTKKTGPDLQGVSGGAIWRLSGSNDVTSSEPLLSAIAIRWRQEDPKCVIGTRIADWVRQAAEGFPVQFKRALTRTHPLAPTQRMCIADKHFSGAASALRS